MIVLYLKKVFSTRAFWWYPDSFFHGRRPTFLTRLTVRSRAVGRSGVGREVWGSRQVAAAGVPSGASGGRA